MRLQSSGCVLPRHGCVSMVLANARVNDCAMVHAYMQQMQQRCLPLSRAAFAAALATFRSNTPSQLYSAAVPRFISSNIISSLEI